MIVAVDQQRTSALRQHFTADRVGHVAIPTGKPVVCLFLRADLVPIDWRVTRDDAQLALLTKLGVYSSNGAEELLVNRHVERCERLRRVLPHAAEAIGRYRFSADKVIHYILIGARYLSD